MTDSKVEGSRPSSSPSAQGSIEERRHHARLSVATNVEVDTDEGPVTVELRDISKGGARFCAPHTIGEAGDSVRMSLAALAKEALTVKAEIVRVEESDDGDLIAVRFVLDDKSRATLEKALIRVLSGDGK